MTNNFSQKANFIWSVADDIMRGAFKAQEYGDVILPIVVLRSVDWESVKEYLIQQAKEIEQGWLK